MARHFREDFDRDRSFVALKNFTFNARGYVTHQAVDKSHFTVRRLRQLYDMRNIGYAPQDAINGADNAPNSGVQAMQTPEALVAPTPITRRRLQPKAAAVTQPIERRRLRA